MTFEPFRAFCARRPGATMDVKWGADEVYSVGGKMFAVFWIDQGRARSLSFKCDPERFLELTDIPGIVPAPYLARAHWVQLREAKALPRTQIESLLARSHALVVAGLPRKLKAAIAGVAPPVSSLVRAAPRARKAVTRKSAR